MVSSAIFGAPHSEAAYYLFLCGLTLNRLMVAISIMGAEHPGNVLSLLVTGEWPVASNGICVTCMKCYVAHIKCPGFPPLALDTLGGVLPLQYTI